MKIAILRKRIESIQAETKHDGTIVLRETSTSVIRDRWAQTRLYIHQMALERDLLIAHISENLDTSLEPAVATYTKKTTWWENAQDKIKVYFCIFLHTKPNYRRGDQFYTCLACSRKYAIPWADLSKIDGDVYVPSKPFLTSTMPIRQAVCRNGVHGLS